ncbi:hypothetical protein [Thalassococcus lentus]|uniref:Uncharacterized protein n=1 Tax=Thalassococcus lentus TaxID=1210524 RepID=A0ABT4XU93_9RHOB|nr:hypothetical protein [Thalassococcus lentus]MDA7425534.1 hypothetical protein [Thalassococcus lentus]
MLLALAGGMDTGGDDNDTQDDHDQSDETVQDDPVITDTTENFDRTGLFVSENMFGVDAVYSVHTDNGIPTETFESALEEFEVDTVRFPSGQAEFDPREADGEGWLDITALTDEGELRPELTNFLDSVDGSVVLTIPTTNAPLESYGEDLDRWAELVMREYGDVVIAFEVGNEYWAAMGETEYGQRANIAVEALARGIAAAGEEDADILVQMGATFGQSEFNGTDDDRPFMDRLYDSNNQIIDQFSETALAEIDGVVEHYYWNQSPIPFEDSRAEVRYMNVDFEIWQSRFDQDLDFYVTEWNLRMGNCPCNGLRSTSILTEMVENMVEMGVDGAYVWPVVHNTSNDLGGPADDGEVRTDDQGRVVETLRGAIFDLMSDVLPGKELIRVDIDGVDNGMEIAAYEGDGEYVFYIGSNSTEPVNFTVDLTDIIEDFVSAQGVVIGYDRETSNGRHYVPGMGWQNAESVMVDGEPYYLNEHDVGATLTDYSYNSPVFNVELDPYEMVQITVQTQ